MHAFPSRLQALTRSLALWLSIAAWASAAEAATWIVDSTSADPALNACTGAPADCSFPGAVGRAAFVGDSIVFTVSESLAAEVEIRKDLIIEAAGARLPRLVITTRGVGWATVTLRNARWENLNSGGNSGGAMNIDQNQIVTIEDSLFLNNRNNNQGGAIFNRGELVVRRTRFEGNFSLGGGAAIHSTSLGTLTAIDSTFRGNGVLDPTGPGRQLGRLGAISAERNLDIRGCLFDSNESRFASAVWSNTLTRIYNSTFTGNKSFEAAEGGTLFLAGPARIANSTIVGNSGIATGGLFVQTSTSDTQVVNTILANVGQSPDVFGRIYTWGNNLIRSRGSALVDVRPGNTNIEGVDPGLAPLANNGGPTLTMLVPSNSPAHNAGADCVLFANGCDGFPHLALDVDQRGTGYARNRGGAVDIGAFELGSVMVTNSQDSGPGSLRQAIADALPGDVVTFSTSHFSQPRTIALASTLVVNKSLGILGPGPNLLTLDAGNQRRHLTVDAPATLNLSGMRFFQGNPGVNADGGAILVNAGTLNASDIRIEGSTANGGGCLYNNGTVELSQVLLSGCRATYAAGLFNAAGRSATIRDSRIEGNIATGPGGGIGNPGGATLTLDRVSLTGNQGTIGGALNSYGTASLSNTTFSGNTGTNGGAMYLGGTGTTALTHATVTLNTAQFNGGIAAEFDAIVNLRGTLIAGNTRTVDQAPDAGGNFTSFGYNLIGNPFATSFRPNSPSLVGNLLGVEARLAPLANNGGHSRTHAPLHDSPIIDAAGTGSVVDGRGLARPIDFTHLANASGGNGSDIGAYELQVATPTDVVATPRDGGLSVAFNGATRGGLAITGYTVTCGAQSATGNASPIVVGGLVNGTAVSCTVVAQAGSVVGIPSAPSTGTAPGAVPGAPVIGSAVAANGQVRVAFTAPASNGGLPISGYTATCGTRSASGSASPISVISLINGAPVSCTVAATNAAGTGPSSAPSSTVTPGLPGAFAYIPKVSQASVTVVDLGTGSVVQNIGLPNGMGGVAASPDGARVYLVSQSTGNVAVIDTQSRAHIATIAVGSRPWSAVVSPDSTRVYVSNGGDAAVSVIDAATNSVVATIPVFNNPTGLAITPDGSRLFVANGGSRALSVIDTTTRQVIATLTVGLDPIGVATSQDGRRAYVTGYSSNDVSVIDVENLTVVGTVAVGSGANGVAVSRDSRRAYVGNREGNSVSVIDAATRTVVATVSVGSIPEGIDVSADGMEVLVVNRGSGDISRISTATNTVVGTINLGGGSPFATGRFVSAGGRAPAFTSDPPAGGLLGVPYSHTLTTSGMPAASFLLASGSLPPGLSLNGAVISGTPTALGTSSGSIQARNDVAGSTNQAFEITIGATVPGAPTIIGATGGNASIEVSFGAPATDGGSAITGYTATCGSQSQSGPASPIVVANLTNGTPVVCTVVATNAIGNSPASTPSSPVTPLATLAFTSALPATGQVRVVYTHLFVATGATAPSYAVESGTLPPGLTLDAASGLLSGTPTAAGTHAARIRASAPGARPATQDVTIAVAPNVPAAPAIDNVTAGDGEVTVSFTAPMDDGGSPVLFYNAVCTSLVGVGSISPITVSPLPNGVPQTCVVTAINAVGVSTASAAANAVIPQAATVLALSSSLNPALPGQPVTFTATATPASATGVVSFDTGTGGTACTPVALVGGVATCTTTYVGAGTRGVTASYAGDVAHRPATATLAGGQRVDAPTITIIGAPPAGTFGTPYGAVSFAASGGVGPYTWAIATGALPPGLNLGSGGSLAGTPIAAGTYAFSVRATDAGQSSATADYTVTVARASQAPLSATATPATIRVGGTSTLATTGGSGTGAVSYTVTAGATSCAVAGATLTGLAAGSCTVTATRGADANHEPATATVAVTVQPAGTDLEISKTNGHSSVLPDSVVEYEILVANAGPLAAQGARVRDPVPTGLTDVLWSCTPVQGATCPATAGTGAIDQLVNLPVAGVLRYVFSARVTAAIGTSITNTASVETPTDLVDLEPADNTASDTDVVVPDPIHRDGFEATPPSISVPLRVP